MRRTVQTRGAGRLDFDEETVDAAVEGFFFADLWMALCRIISASLYYKIIGFGLDWRIYRLGWAYECGQQWRQQPSRRREAYARKALLRLKQGGSIMSLGSERVVWPGKNLFDDIKLLYRK